MPKSARTTSDPRSGSEPTDEAEQPVVCGKVLRLREDLLVPPALLAAFGLFGSLGSPGSSASPSLSEPGPELELAPPGGLPAGGAPASAVGGGSASEGATPNGFKPLPADPEPSSDATE